MPFVVIVAAVLGLASWAQAAPSQRLPYRIIEGSQPIWTKPMQLGVHDRTWPAPIRTAPPVIVPGSEFRPILVQGPEANRICLTITGDGYTESERERFFQDAARITDGLFKGRTFSSYLPLFNVYAVFVPSTESGITDLTKKNTAFGLTRFPAGSKRAIYPENEQAIEDALTLAPKTDYPIVLANDEFYGGLGGRYAITTRSVESGLIVLRHELGHNFGEVGEEYDNGGYFGANTTDQPAAPAWKHWIDPAKKSAPEWTNESIFLSGNYVWQNLSGGSVLATFDFPAADPVHGAYGLSAQVSGVGWGTPGDVSFLVDGTAMPLIGVSTDDRSFYVVALDRTLAPGPHTMEVRENAHDGNNVLAFALLYAYPGNYDFGTGVGAYSTYAGPVKPSAYRPTHDGCLMRDMLKDYFCAVDQENMWKNFLDQVRLIDGVKTDATGVSRVETQKLPGLKVRWFQKNTAGTQIEVASVTGPGDYVVEVSFQTSEVRAPTSRFVDRFQFSR
ncbi:MAG: hypothetical protein JNL01_15245 [Bdellovibrionales bacterium]|nr:hypothetical protein [Bdellovibrionales bacterium]